MKFKERFDYKLKAYNAALGPTTQVSDKRAAMAFLNKLNRTQYGQFYANEVNAINKDPTQSPATVNEVFQRAKAYIVVYNTTKPNGTPVAFATTADNLIKSNKKRNPNGRRGGNNKGGGNANANVNPLTAPTTSPATAPTTNESKVESSTASTASTVPTANLSNPRQARDVSKVHCYNCNVFGHFARDCPNNVDDSLTVMTTKDKKYYQPTWYEVGLDTLSQVNVLNSRFPQDFVPGEGGFRGLSNQSRSTSYHGTLPVIPGLQCQVCDDCAMSILSFAAIKKTGVPITYDQVQECFIVHSPIQDIVFHQRGDLYLADFRDFVTDRAIAAMTTQQREQLFDKSLMKRAKEAGTFIRSAGLPSE